MNRPIKFRVWDKKYKEFVEDLKPLYIFLNNNGNLCISNSKRYILMQFTGPLDKNGKKIYEGDIIDLIGDKKYLAETIYSEEFGSFQSRDIKTGKKSSHLYGANLSEIIGNIYENPKLIKE